MHVFSRTSVGTTTGVPGGGWARPVKKILFGAVRPNNFFIPIALNRAPSEWFSSSRAAPCPPAPPRNRNVRLRLIRVAQLHNIVYYCCAYIYYDYYYFFF